LLGVCVFAVDFAVKLVVQHFLPTMASSSLSYPYGGVGVFHDFLGIEFSITHSTNTGAAWGIMSDYQQLLLLGRILIILGLIWYVFFLRKLHFLYIPIILIVAGALGNVADYFLYGHVIDMFNFVFWGYAYPVFNVADSSICSICRRVGY